jgi:hypothetical protein
MLCRWIVGIAFIVASLHKIAHPAAFAQIVYSYDLFPAFTINLVAIILPYVELVAGLALMTAVYPRAAAGIVSALLVAFALIITINLLRGHNFDCGCFPTVITRLYADTPVSMLVRDAVLLAATLPVAFYRHQRRGVVFKSARG